MTTPATIQAAAKTYQVEPALIRALIHAESASIPGRLPQGRHGTDPADARHGARARVGNALLAEQNIFGGVKYLAGLLKRYDGNVALATAACRRRCGTLAAYRPMARPVRFQKHGAKGLYTAYAETRAYVERVKLLHQRYKEMLSARDCDHAAPYRQHGALLGIPSGIKHARGRVDTTLTSNITLSWRSR